ncbi:MAG: GTPase domain-containing protein [Planctomycetota bacterium]
MTDQPWLPPIAERLRRLRAQCARLELPEITALLAARLQEAQARLTEGEGDSPLLHVAMFGGTGVGKSALFNALVGIPGASPVSHAERCFTKHPIVAVRPAERTLVRLPHALEPLMVDAAWRGLAVIDAPDIDGALKENWHAARELVRLSDVILYVTTPDRRADFDVQQELRQWAARKRWLFVLNKADLVEKSIDDIRADFDLRLRELGFEPGDGVRFVVSATQPERFDLPRLRATLLDGQLSDQIDRLRWDAALGAVQYAVDEESVSPLLALSHEVAEEEQALSARLRQIYRESFEQPVARHAFRAVIREQTWQYMGERIGWLMALPIWVRRRLSLLATTFHLSRLGLRGFSVLGILGAAGSAVGAILRGTLPMRRILSALGPRYRRELSTLQAEARRFLDDRQLEALAGLEESPPNSTRPGSTVVTDGNENQGRNQPQGALVTLENLVQQLAADPAERQLVEQLQADVDNLAQQAAVGAGGWFTNLVANLLPTAMLGHILWRMGEAWWKHEYLPWPFYAMAILLLLASMLPGYLLVSLRVRGRALRPDVEQLVGAIEEPMALRALSGVRRELERVAADAGRLRHEVTSLRRTMGAGLPAAVDE